MRIDRAREACHALRLLMTDREEARAALRRRRRAGLDRFDEVWNGVDVMAPMANDEHQTLATRLAVALQTALGWDQGEVIVGCKVSDRRGRDWRRNDRCPDVAVFLLGNPAQNQGSPWFGGPDFTMEVV